MAELMLAEAQSVESDRIFSATGYARENISILHQQIRCGNLAWALRQGNRLRRGDVVAIVGGSFSGLMIACSLAIANDVIVYILEKDERLLHRFLDKSHRYLSPNLNTRELGKAFDPSWSRPHFTPAIFKWEAGAASDVASTWLHEFDQYRRKLPIFAFLGARVYRTRIRQNGGKLTVAFRKARGVDRSIEVDLLIDATGFGDEANPYGLVDFSYWESGHRLIYDHLPDHSHVMVSGCGDSGIVELMHYAIEDFHHKLVESLWPLKTRLEGRIDVGLEEATLPSVLRSAEVERYDSKVISELCWWLDTWWLLAEVRGHSSFDRALLEVAGPLAGPTFYAIEKALQPSLIAAFSEAGVKKLSWDEREAFLLELPLTVQLSVRDQIRSLVDDWISLNIAELVASIPIGRFLYMRRLHRMARPGTTVTLNGVTPTPYSRQMSRFVVWLTSIMMTFPNVYYRRGRIADVKVRPDGRYDVSYADGSRDEFDRVVTRYGVAGRTGRQRLSTRRSRDPHAGDWLLTSVSYNVATDHPDIFRGVDPAVDCVERQLVRLPGRRGSDPSRPLNKRLYQLHLLESLPPPADLRYLEPQAWLSSQLRSGVRPSYVE